MHGKNILKCRGLFIKCLGLVDSHGVLLGAKQIAESLKTDAEWIKESIKVLKRSSPIGVKMTFRSVMLSLSSGTQ